MAKFTPKQFHFSNGALAHFHFGYIFGGLKSSDGFGYQIHQGIDFC